MRKRAEQNEAMYLGQINALRAELERPRNQEHMPMEEPVFEAKKSIISLQRRLGTIKAEFAMNRMRIKELLKTGNSEMVDAITRIQSLQVRRTSPIPLTWVKAELKEIRKQISAFSVECMQSLERSMEETQAFSSQAHSQEILELKEKLRQETLARRKLHNTVLELKGNIRVFVRVRPMLPAETQTGAFPCVKVISDTDLSIECGSRSGNPLRAFSFDRVLDSSIDNDGLFTELQQLLISTMDGFNVAAIAYGITGSGKTFTMDGVYERIGIGLFSERAERERCGNWRYAVALSVYEVYNETIVDLLNLKNLNTGLKTNPSTGMFYIPGITRVDIASSADLTKVWSEAARNRSVSSTHCNQQSSRSHLITMLHVSITTPSGRKVDSQMSLVDLAGSERLDKSGADGTVAKEAVHINKSLSALGDVINARVNKAAHVPFRNSVLTSALQECISGESKTLVLLNVSPSSDTFDETCNSLVFGSRIREVGMNKQVIGSPRKR